MTYDDIDYDDIPQVIEEDEEDYKVCSYCGHVINSYDDDGDGCHSCRPEAFKNG